LEVENQILAGQMFPLDISDLHLLPIEVAKLNHLWTLTSTLAQQANIPPVARQIGAEAILRAFKYGGMEQFSARSAVL
jgi:hypothetical protein